MDSEISRTSLPEWLGPGEPTPAASAARAITLSVGFVMAIAGVYLLFASSPEPEPATPAPIDLRGVGRKFRPGALAAFLPEAPDRMRQADLPGGDAPHGA